MYRYTILVASSLVLFVSTVAHADTHLHALSQCLSGPTGPLETGCEASDLDLDEDVDLGDFAMYQAAPNCPALSGTVIDLQVASREADCAELVWSPVSGAYRYDVYVDGLLQGTVYETEASVGFTPGVNHALTVRACTDCECTEESEPTWVSYAAKVVAGSEHTCVLTGRGEIFCFGRNLQGVLGRGLEYGEEPGQLWRDHTPERIDTSALGLYPDEVFVDIASGAYHVAALTSAGRMVSWGDDSYGQLGIGQVGSWPYHSTVPVIAAEVINDRHNPEELSPMPPMEGVSARGVNTCVWTASGTGYCVGANETEQLCVPYWSGGYYYWSYPVVTLDDLYDWSWIVVGGWGTDRSMGYPVFGFAFGFTQNWSAGLLGWGDQSYGELGDGETQDYSVYNPDFVEWLPGGDCPPTCDQFSAISLGEAHACAVYDDGTPVTHEVWCWGRNNRGQLGVGDYVGYDTPQWTGLDLDEVKGIMTGFDFTCVSTSDDVLCWGYNNHGQLGRDRVTEPDVPAPLPMLMDGLTTGETMSGDMAGGIWFSCFIAEDTRNVYGLGYNGFGQLGTGDFTYNRDSFQDGRHVLIKW